VAVAVVVLLFALVGFVPQLGGPTYELALLAGLIVPSTAALSTAWAIGDPAWHNPQPLAVVALGLRRGLVLAIAVLIVTLLHGVRAGFCGPAQGLVLFGLGPTPGALLGGVWGGAVALFARRRRRRRRWLVLLALAGPAGSALVQGALFYSTPMVFAYDPFAGYFSGALYDTVIDDAALWSYRAASAATLLALYSLAAHLSLTPNGKLKWRPTRVGLALLGTVMGLSSIASVVWGDRLGHWQTAGTIADRLGGELVVGRCTLRYDRALAQEHVRLLARDCDQQIGVLGRWLELDEPPPVTAYVFAHAGQKRRLMGAARTMIAKPWRHEIYLNDAAYPHRTMGHELVHALASNKARGPFGVAGEMGGWLPNPGLIEGLAVAGAPRAGQLSNAEWAAAMRRIGVLPPLKQLFALSFFGSAASTSYTAAGAFIAHARERHGMALVLRWYGGEQFTALTGLSWGELEQQWHSALDALPLDKGALAQARARFDRPSVFGRVCPHEVDAELARANQALAAGYNASALAGFEHVLTLDPGSTTALFGRASCFERSGEQERATLALEAVWRNDQVTVATHQTAIERLGDISLRAGDWQRAAAHYRTAMMDMVSERRRRTLEIKAHYADDSLARTALLALLVGVTPAGPDNTEALDRIGEWRAARPDDGTPDYLFARQHINNRNYDLAATRLDSALAIGVPLARVEKESLRLRIHTACALGDVDVARDRLEHYRMRADVAPPMKRATERLVARCVGGSGTTSTR